jgi:hypothetical protein
LARFPQHDFLAVPNDDEQQQEHAEPPLHPEAAQVGSLETPESATHTINTRCVSRENTT